jgi:hypothetical protein
MTSRAVVGICSTLVMLFVVALGAIDGLVWMPLALAPDYTLTEIHAAMDAVGEGSGSVGLIVAWAVLWGLAALVPTVLGLHPRIRRGPANVRLVVLVALLIGVGAIFFQWWAAFSMGMSVSDTLPPYTGGQSAFWPWYAAAGLSMLVVAVVLLVVRPSSRESVDATT